MSTSPENRGRVKLDLEAFFTDYRRHSYILLKTAWSSVKDLKEYVEKTFQLTDVVIMTTDEVYLPLNEAIEIVCADDELKAVTSSYVPRPSPPKETKDGILLKSTFSPPGIEAGIRLKPKRKRTHKRKLSNTDIVSQVAQPKPPPKILKPNTTANNISHVRFDDECKIVKLSPVEVKFVNYIDSLDANKPRVITASGRNVCTEGSFKCGLEDKASENPIKVPFPLEVAAA